MKLYAAVMLGGALGSALRFGVSLWVAEKAGGVFPWGTFVVNVVGSFVIGLFAGLVSAGDSWAASPTMKAFVVVGILGGFTTFSSFSFQTVELMQSGRLILAMGNVVLSVVVCLIATAAGLALSRAWS